MKEIDLKEMRQIQLEMMQHIHEFCVDNNLHYTLAYGTLIGAIRHKAYIPWDDDIDIMMQRPDYNRFVLTYNKQSGYYKVHSLENDHEYDVPWAKVEDTRTYIKETTLRMNMGIFIDIFPIDNLFDTKEECMNLHKKVRYAILFDSVKNSIISSIKKRSTRIYYSFLKIILLPYSLTYFTEKVDRLAKSGVSNSKYIGVAVTIISSRIWFTRDMFTSYHLVPFEQYQFYVVDSYDTILRMTFGDYMQLPPVEQRVTHKFELVCWK